VLIMPQADRFDAAPTAAKSGNRRSTRQSCFPDPPTINMTQNQKGKRSG